jgi:putative endonuclease
MPDRRRVGREAEDRAAQFLLGEGLTLVTRRYSARGGEIDLIVLDGEILVFVEVRQRGPRSPRPEETIDRRKSARIAAAADAYLRDTGIKSRTIRFDLVAVDALGLRHYKDFFRSP